MAVQVPIISVECARVAIIIWPYIEEWDDRNLNLERVGQIMNVEAAVVYQRLTQLQNAKIIQVNKYGFIRKKSSRLFGLSNPDLEFFTGMPCISDLTHVYDIQSLASDYIRLYGRVPLNEIYAIGVIKTICQSRTRLTKPQTIMAMPTQELPSINKVDLVYRYARLAIYLWSVLDTQTFQLIDSSAVARLLSYGSDEVDIFYNHLSMLREFKIIKKNNQGYARGDVSYITIIKSRRDHSSIIPGVEILVDDKTVYDLNDLAALWAQYNNDLTTH